MSLCSLLVMAVAVQASLASAARPTEATSQEPGVGTQGSAIGSQRSAISDQQSAIVPRAPHSTLNAQPSTVSCGVGAAYLLLARMGQEVPVEQIQAASPAPADGPMSLADLRRLFENLGFAAEGFQMSLDRLDRPVIAFQPHPKDRAEAGHFFVVEPIAEEGSAVRVQGSGAGEFLVLDAHDPPLKMSAERLRPGWDGRVLVVYPRGTKTSASGASASVLGLTPSSVILVILACGAAVALLVQKGVGYRCRNGPKGASHNDTGPLFDPASQAKA